MSSLHTCKSTKNHTEHTKSKMTQTTRTPLICISVFLLLFFINYSLAITIFPDEALPTRSGYLQVNPKSTSSMYYAFYEAQTPTGPLSETPLVLWLQGGPGCSSMIGNFLELGPYRVDQGTGTEQVGLVRNPGSWNRIFGLLFIDNPIGVGLSVASDPADIPTDQMAVAEHLYAAIRGFLGLDSEFWDRPLYVTGESYAGKYVPAIGYYIVKRNSGMPVSKRINLKGIAIGNGLTDPVTQVQTHASNAYFSGLINNRQRGLMEEAQLEAVRLVETGDWAAATDARNRVLRMLEDMTGLATLYDYTKKAPYKTSRVTKLLQSEEIKRAIRANVSIEFDECSDTVEAALHADVMKSVKHMVEFLIETSKVLLYQGFYDLRDGVVSTEAWVQTLRWDGIERFLGAEREVWRVDGELAGYVQRWGSLSHTVVLGAGHLVPTDQPLNSQAMIEDWILERGNFANVQHKERIGLELTGSM